MIAVRNVKLLVDKKRPHCLYSIFESKKTHTHEENRKPYITSHLPRMRDTQPTKAVW